MTPEKSETLSQETGYRPEPGVSRDFRTTHWSIVLAAGKEHSAATAKALEQLCATYRYPIYAFIRRRGHDHHSAEDLTQGFFEYLLEHEVLKRVEQKGKFRCFLLVSVKYFLANEWDRRRAAKRGGGVRLLSLDEQQAEQRYAREPFHDCSPEKLFEQTLAFELLKRVEQRLSDEYRKNGKTILFAALQDRLLGEPTAGAYKELGVQLQMSESAVRMAALRLRSRFRELLHEEIAQTVSAPSEIPEELSYLAGLFGR